ncbi:MAG: S8 family serine peptidase [Bdellovibrio sp.]|nr:S8 family serine peptidase [Bdellovibrio sp.]
MKKVCAFLFLSLLNGTSVFAQKSQCIPEPKINSILTGNWYLEYTGADLAKKYVRQNGGGSKIGVGIIDGSLAPADPGVCGRAVRTPTQALNADLKNIHGTLVANMMYGDHGASNHMRNVHSVVYGQWRSDDAEILPELEEAARSGMRVVNMSIAEEDKAPGVLYANQKQKLEGYKKLDNAGVIMVTVAGNQGDKHPNLFLAKSLFPGIVVGSMSPRGAMSSFSQYGKQVTILAPGESVVVKDDKGQLDVTSGTSFAAPLVAGSIVNTLQVLPELNRKNIETLMAKTAVNINLKKQNQRMLNSYKMVMVASRIKNALARNAAQSKVAQEALIQKLLQDPKTFDFSVQGQDLIKQAQVQRNAQDCTSFLAAIERYREAFLLTESKEAAQALAELYQEAGLGVNSTFYSKLGKVPK